MAKRYKKEVKRIDMSARLLVEVVPATEEEIEQINREFEELFLAIEYKNKLYEEELSKTISEKLFEDFSVLEDEDSKEASYFIEKYDTMLKQQNHNNVQQRINQYLDYFDKKMNTN